MKPRIFVGSSTEGLKIAYPLQENLEHDAEITVWPQGVFELSTPTLLSLIKGLGNFDFGIFVFSPDDVVKIRGKEVSAVRDNVVFEFGLFIGRLGLDHTFFVVPRGHEPLHLPTDIAGITPATYEANRSDGNLRAALGPACNQIRTAIQALERSTAVVPPTAASPEPPMPPTMPTDREHLRPPKSDATMPNPCLLVDVERHRSNIDWLEKYGRNSLKDGSLLLVGGTSATHFHLRVAQACSRDDMAPSLWSHVAICTAHRDASWTLTEISLEPEHGFGAIQGRNAVHESRLDSYDDPRRWPNIAIVSFPVHGHRVSDSMWAVANDRRSVDLVELVMSWLASVSGTSPFPQGKGIPSAVFAMTVMERAGLPFPPGFSPHVGSPEALWQLAKWWYRFYEERVRGQEPLSGRYIIRQPAAAMV